MGSEDLSSTVRNDRIEFATARPPGSRFATLERRVIVTGPPEMVALARSGDVRLLDGLVELLGDPDRAWAAAVLLAAMTGREEKLIDTFSTRPKEWWRSSGRTAHERWSAWLAEARHRLVWDPEQGMFLDE